MTAEQNKSAQIDAPVQAKGRGPEAPGAADMELEEAPTELGSPPTLSEQPEEAENLPTELAPPEALKKAEESLTTALKEAEESPVEVPEESTSTASQKAEESPDEAKESPATVPQKAEESPDRAGESPDEVKEPPTTTLPQEAEESPTEESATTALQEAEESPTEESPTGAIEEDPAEVTAAPGGGPVSGPPVLEGSLGSFPVGPIRVVTLLTGAALAIWFARGLLWLLGYRHRGRIGLEGEVIQITAERSLMGIPLGKVQQAIPVSALQSVRYARRSGVWTVIAGLGALIIAGATGTVLLLWGIVGQQPSWVALGLVAIGGGILLDALAFLWGRRQAARRRVTLAIVTARKRFLIGPFPQQGAGGLVEALNSALAEKH